MPEGLARGGIKSQQIPRVISAEKKMSRGCKDPRNAFPVTYLVVPHYFAGAVVERTQRGIGPQVSVAASPSFGFPFCRIVINTEKAAAVHVKQPRLRIKTWCHPICRAIRPGFDERAIRSRRGFGLGDRPSSTVNPIRPRLID